MMHSPNFSSPRLPKRKRLSYACNYCRAKKTRCDEQFPSCRNCQLAGIKCVTVNKRRPNVLVQNRRADLASTGRQIETEPSRATIALASPETSGTSPSSLATHVPIPGSARSRSQSLSSTLRDTPEWPNWDTRHLPVMPVRVGSSAVHISTQWLDIALARLKIPSSFPVRMNLGPCLFNPCLSSEHPILCMEPDPPPFDELQKLMRLFFKLYHPVYPFLDPQHIEMLLEGVFDKSNIHDKPNVCGRAARLMLLYLITILGSMSSFQVFSSSLNTYLAFCHTLLGHIVRRPALESVQALLLFSITLRLQDQLSQAWDVLTLAISMAQTLKLADMNAKAPPGQINMLDTRKDAPRTWWALYVFEKFLAFDSGRKPSLEDPKLASLGLQDATKLPDQGETPKLQIYQHSMTTLANALHEMQNRSWHTWRKESLETKTEAEARASKIHAAGEIDILLCKWRASLPLEYQIGTFSAADLQLAPQWAFLSFYYHQAIIVLYRNTLLLDWNELRKEVDQYGSGKPWHLRLGNGPQLCLDAAKEMTNFQVMITEASEPSFLRLATSPLAAAYVLAIYICRQPASILSRTNFELMKAAIAISRQRHPIDTAEDVLHRHLDALEQHINQLLTDAANGSFIEAGEGSTENNIALVSHTSAAPSSLLEPSLTLWESFEWMSWDWNELFPQD